VGFHREGLPLEGARLGIPVIDELGRLGVRYLYLLGGEPLPLLNRGLLDVVRRGKERGMF